jgi:acyl dehydratase
METVGLGFCFEDLPVGRQFRTIGRTVTEADITNFINCTGMVEVSFTNLEFLAHKSDIKRRLAPAVLVYVFAEGLLVQSTMQHTGLAFLHMELNVENSVFTGDTVPCRMRDHRSAAQPQPTRSRARPYPRPCRQTGRHRGADLYAAAHGQVPYRRQFGVSWFNTLFRPPPVWQQNEAAPARTAVPQ